MCRLSNGETNGNLDTNQSSDFDARVVLRPFNSPEFDEFLRGWQVGVSGGYGREDEAVSPAALRTPAGVTWFTYNSKVSGGWH